MSPHDDDFERRLMSWLQADAPEQEPAGLLEAVVARTATTRRRPGWAIAERWLPAIVVPISRPRATSSTVRLLIVAGVIVAIAAGVVAVGSLPRLPPRVGLARAGVIAFDTGGKIIVVNADGTDRRNLSSSLTFETSPSFSPDGTKIAYWSRQAAAYPASLWVMNADGSNQHGVTGTADFSGSENLQAVWSPDSQELAFAVGDYFSSSQLYVVRVDGTAMHQVGGGSLARSDPAWSPDGRLIAFRGHSIGVLSDTYPPDPAAGVYVIAADGTGERKVSRSLGAGGGPNWASFGGPEVGAAPSWSPDGKSLLFATGTTGRHVIAIAAADGVSERVIGLPTGDDLVPAFSPDGSRIAFEALSTSGDQARAFAVNIDGTGLRPLNGGAPVAPNPLFWSPDGRFVVLYAVDLSEIRLCVADQEAASGSVGLSRQTTVGAAADIGFADRASWQRLAP